MNQTTKPTNKTIKSLARQMFKGYFFEALLILIMIEVIVTVPGKIIDTFFSKYSFLLYLADVYSLLIRGPLQFGTTIYFLCNFRNQRVRYNCLMYGFDYFSKAAAIYVFTFILTTAGFIFFFVPGIIVMMNYSQAMFILVDDPQKQALQCMRESKAMMKGHRMDLLSFAVSYWLPFVLTRAPEVILTHLITEPITLEQMQSNPLILAQMQNKVFDSPWYILCQFAMLLFAVYFNMGKAAFYDILSGNLIFSDETPDDEVVVEEPVAESVEEPAQLPVDELRFIFKEVPRVDSTMDEPDSPETEEIETESDKTEEE